MDGLYRPQTWAYVATAFNQAMEGQGAIILDYPYLADERELSRTAVTCNDQPLFDAPSVNDIVEERLYVYQNVSRFAFAVASLENSDIGCQYWPVSPPEKFQGPWNHTLKNPILIISNTVR